MKKILFTITILSLILTSYVLAVTEFDTNFGITMSPNTTYTFNATDFTTPFASLDKGTLTRVSIQSLPSSGKLRISDASITSLPQEIDITSIGNLTYEPTDDFEGAVSFNWKGKTATETVDTMFTTTILVKEGITTSVAISILENQTYTFKHTDFTDVFNDLEVGDLSSINILTKPTTESGRIRLNGDSISTVPQTVNAISIEDLTFVPTKDYTGTATFTWSGNTNENRIPTIFTTTITINELTGASITPVSKTLTTEVNVSISDKLKIEESYKVNYIIVTEPAHGTVQNLNTTTGEFQYIPERNYRGDDTFTFKAKVGDIESAEGTITIEISENQLIIPFRYEDMQDHWANYSASHLAAMNVIIGENINHEYFFYPDRLVTRADFVIYMLSALGINYIDESSTFKFADDAKIESWLKPYVYTAYNKGIINGSLNNGKIYFKGDDYITRAQVATIINNAMDFKYQNTSTLTFTDRSQIPSWATAAIRNMVGYEIIVGSDDNRFRPNEIVTKAELSEILYKAIKEKQLEVEAEENE